MLGPILRSLTAHLVAAALLLPAAAFLVEAPSTPAVEAPAALAPTRSGPCVRRACKRPRNLSCSPGRQR